jgi:uncharacterized damage-inducible protein DinB
MASPQFPSPDEYAPYWARYISQVTNADVLSVLRGGFEETLSLLDAAGEARAGYRYAPDKWSVRQVIGHLLDTERIWTYRALRIARNDRTPLAGFEQDDYVRFGPFENCSLAELAEELEAVRHSTICLYRSLDEEGWSRRGTASDMEVSVRALAFTTAGHEIHHRRILREKYGL